VSEQGSTSRPTQIYVISGMAFPDKIVHTHNNRTSLTFTKSLTFVKHKMPTKKRPEPKIVRTADYNCAYVMVMAVLTIFPVFLQTVINLYNSVYWRSGKTSV